MARALGALKKGKTILTCRSSMWEERKRFLPGEWRESLDERELVSLDRNQQEEFVARFFGGEEGQEGVGALETLLQDSLWLRYACANPLLLSFSCMLVRSQRAALAEGTMGEGDSAEIVRPLFETCQRIFWDFGQSTLGDAKSSRCLQQIAEQSNRSEEGVRVSQGKPDSKYHVFILLFPQGSSRGATI